MVTATIPQPYRFCWRHHVLALELARREVFDRYGNAALGAAWIILQPLALMAVLAFVFSFVFKIKFVGEAGSAADYTIFMCAGYQAWIGLTVSLAASTQAVVGNTGLLKQVEFPAPVLVVKAVLVGLISQAVGMGFVILYAAIVCGHISALLPLIVPLLALQTLMLIGLGWMCASVTVFFRDFSEVLSTFFMINLYILPIVYPPTVVPAAFALAIAFNPFSHMIYCYQDALVYGAFEHGWSWLIFAVLALASFHFGFRFFRATERVFGDLI